MTWVRLKATNLQARKEPQAKIMKALSTELWFRRAELLARTACRNYAST